MKQRNRQSNLCLSLRGTSGFQNPGINNFVLLLRSYLEEVGRKLTEAGIPHSTAVGTLEDGGAVMAAAAAAGIADFEEHLWLGSLLETFYLIRHEKKQRGDLPSMDTPESIAEVTNLSCHHFLRTNRCG